MQPKEKDIVVVMSLKKEEWRTLLDALRDSRDRLPLRAKQDDDKFSKIEAKIGDCICLTEGLN